jgi:hypothetical protein
MVVPLKQNSSHGALKAPETGRQDAGGDLQLLRRFPERTFIYNCLEFSQSFYIHIISNPKNRIAGRL